MYFWHSYLFDMDFSLKITNKLMLAMLCGALILNFQVLSLIIKNFLKVENDCCFAILHRWMAKLWNDVISTAVKSAIIKGKEGIGDNNGKVTSTALYVLLQRVVVPGCPLTGAGKYHKTFQCLTLCSIDTHFNASTTDSFWKHCEKRRNCS